MESNSSAIFSTSATTDFYDNDSNNVGIVPHEPNSPGAITEAATLIVIMIGSFFANILAMTQIMTSPKLRRNHHNLLIFNLNVIDLGITIFSMTFSVAAIFDNGDLLKNNSIVCTINGFCAITCSVGNFTNVMCIAVDRYISIVWSTRYPPTRRRVLIMIAFVWIVSVTITLPPTFGFLSSFEYTDTTHHCSPKWDVCSYFTIWFTVIFGMTVPVMILSYVCVIYYIRKTERQLRSHDGFKISKKLYESEAASNHQNSPISARNELPNPPRGSPQVRKLRVNGQRAHYTEDNREVSSKFGRTDLSNGSLGASTEVHNLRLNEQHGSHAEESIPDPNVNVAFQIDEPFLHEVQVDLSSSEAVMPKPFSISGQVATRTASIQVSISEQINIETSRHRLGRTASNRDSSSGQTETGVDITSKDTTTASRSPQGSPGSQRRIGNIKSEPVHQKNSVLSVDSAKSENTWRKISASRSKLSTEKQVACTGALLVLTTIVCWVPYNVIHFCYAPIEVEHPFAAATMWIAYANALLDPLVYVFMNRKASTVQHIGCITTTIRNIPIRLWRWLCSNRL